PRHRAAAPVAGRARLGGGSHLLQAPRAGAVRRARGAERAPRQPRDRVGPAAARAERLVEPCLCGTRREHQAPTGAAPAEGNRDRVAVMQKSSRSTRELAPGFFRWRSYLLQGLLALAALTLAYRAVNLQLVDHGFLAKEGDARFSRVLDIA